ncbi:MAG: hypothetical protein JWO82_1660 [Akkermansiaceae bacterium]|nr:hypothetical protein [Akkermansiaceae bacterium]
MNADALEPSWLDEVPVTKPPFKVGDVLERPDREDLRYYRIIQVTEDGQKIMTGAALGVIEGANAPNIAKAISA